MSPPEPSTSENTQGDWLAQVSATWVGAIVQLGLLGLLFNQLLFANLSVSIYLQAGCMVCVLYMVITKRGWWLLVPIQLGLLINEPLSPNREFASPASLFYSFMALIGLVAACCLPYLHASVTATVTWLAELFAGVDNDKTKDAIASEQKVRLWITQSTSRFLLQVFLILVISSAVYAWIPIRNAISPWQQWAVETGMAVWPGATMLAILCGLLLAANQFDWQQMDAKQASLYLRSTRFHLTYQDLRGVYLQRQRWRWRQAKRDRTKVAKPASKAKAPPKISRS